MRNALTISALLLAAALYEPRPNEIHTVRIRTFNAQLGAQSTYLSIPVPPGTTEVHVFEGVVCIHLEEHTPINATIRLWGIDWQVTKRIGEKWLVLTEPDEPCEWNSGLILQHTKPIGDE